MSPECSSGDARPAGCLALLRPVPGESPLVVEEGRRVVPGELQLGGVLPPVKVNTLTQTLYWNTVKSYQNTLSAPNLQISPLGLI